MAESGNLLDAISLSRESGKRLDTYFDERIEQKTGRLEAATVNEWLREIVSIVGLNEIDGTRCVGWATDSFDGDDLVFSPHERRRLDAGEALSGTGNTLAVKARTAAERAAMVPGGWVRFAQGSLAATLRAMAKQGESPEDQVDVLVHSLLAVREQVGPAVSQLMLAARARLDAQEEAQRTSGYYKTRGALADTLGERKDTAARRRRAFLYLELLRDLQRRASWSSDWYKIVNADANNLAVALSDLGEQPDIALRAMRLSLSAGSAERVASRKAVSTEIVSLVAQVLRPLAQGSKGAIIPGEWAFLLDDIANVPTIWIDYKAGEGVLGAQGVLCIELAAAAARAATGVEARKVVSSLFNAGVTMTREEEGVAWRNEVDCRIAVNAAGLLWALVAAPKGIKLHEALGARQGAQCAVNLMGAVADMQVVDPAIPIAVAEFIGTLQIARGQIPEDIYFRISGSLEKLGIKPDAIAGGGDVVAALTSLVALLLPEGTPQWREHWGCLTRQPDAKRLGDFLALVFRQGVGIAFAKVAGQVTALLEDIEQSGKDWPQAMREFDLDLPWVRDVERELNDWRETLRGGKTLDRIVVDMAEELVE